MPHAIDVANLRRENLADHLIAPLKAVEHLPSFRLEEVELQNISRGLFIERSMIQDEPPHTEFAALDACGNLAGILHRRSDGRIGPVRNFLSE
jgi:hypothetical protein